MEELIIISPEVFERLNFLLIRILPIVILGIIAGNLLKELGYVDKASFVAKPITKYANLSPEAGASITAMLASPAASYSMLANFHDQGVLTDRETIITTFTNTFFLYLRYIPMYYLPFVLPILGLNTGLMYLATRLFVSLVSTIIGIVLGYLFLSKKPNEEKTYSSMTKKEQETNKQKIRSAIKESIPILKKIIPRLVIIYLIVAIALANNLFEPLGKIAEPVTKYLGIPGEASTIVIARLADVSSSYVLTGELLTKGIVNSIQAITALLIGSVLSLSTHFVKNSLPNKIAYFGSGLGTKIAFYNLILSVSTIIITIFLLNFLAF